MYIAVLQETYHRAIYDSKEVIKMKGVLSSAILASRPDLNKVKLAMHSGTRMYTQYGLVYHRQGLSMSTIVDSPKHSSQ